MTSIDVVMKVIGFPVFYISNIEYCEFSQWRSDLKLTHIQALRADKQQLCYFSNVKACGFCGAWTRPLTAWRGSNLAREHLKFEDQTWGNVLESQYRYTNTLLYITTIYWDATIHYSCTDLLLFPREFGNLANLNNYSTIKYGYVSISYFSKYKMKHFHIQKMKVKKK